MMTCHHCGHPWHAETSRPGFKETCARCDAWLHCCMNCRLHDPTRHNHCQSPTTDFVADKRAFNYCEEFEFRWNAVETPPDAESEPSRSRLDALFGDAPAEEPHEGADAFRRLFGD